MQSGMDQWPEWVERLAATGITLAVAWSLGHLINRLVVSRIATFTRRTGSTWDDAVVGELRTRVPFWSVLIGAWLSIGFWELPAQPYLLATRVVFVIAAGSVTIFAAAVASRFIASYGAAITPTIPITSLTQNVAWMLVVVFGLLIILNGLGISIAPMLTALGVGGLAVALALQEPLANLFAGLFITLAGKVRVGDYVQLDSGEEGFIDDFSWRSTRLRRLQNNLIIIPNAKLAQAIITNYDLPQQELAVLVTLGVDYASDLGQVERVTIEVAAEVMREVSGGVPAFEPFIRYNEFADSSINFTVIMRGQRFTDQFLIKHEFVKRLHGRYEAEGITIPWPIRTLVARDALPLATPAAPAAPSPAGVEPPQP